MKQNENPLIGNYHIIESKLCINWVYQNVQEKIDGLMYLLWQYEFTRTHYSCEKITCHLNIVMKIFDLQNKR